MNNRMWNSSNPHQTDVEKVLCVCSAGLLRSPTTANVLQSNFGLNTRAVGLETDFALIPIDPVLLNWADTVVVMEFSQAQRVAELCSKNNIPEPEIFNFNIPDKFGWMDSELVKMVENTWNNREHFRWN